MDWIPPHLRCAHRYASSGWCEKGCGLRDDGRLVSRAGEVLSPGPAYTLEELEAHRRLVSA